MKNHQKFTAALTALLILSYRIPAFAAETELPPGDMPMISANALPSDETAVSENTLPASENPVCGDPLPDSETAVSGNTLPPDEASISGNALPSDIRSDDVPESESTVPKPPAFNAKIQKLSCGYVVKGTFTEFRDDISRIRTLYSLDGVDYQKCGEDWNIRSLGTEDPDKLAALQTQICLYDRFEPLKSYLSGTIDCFYLKLEITLKNSRTYESRTAVIDRGNPQPVPEGMTLSAQFPSSLSVIERNPLYCYGRYQITVSPTATPEDIAALLPDTLPLNIHLILGSNPVADCTVDCPILWKSLSLPRLAAGESVTIPDAAEDIVIPCGTLLRTPVGVFQTEEPLALMQDTATSDEVRLVLNVVPEDSSPTGVLSQGTAGLEAAFDLKPTGATAIHAYTFSEQNPQWVQLPDLPLSSTVNAHPSAANSGYTLVLRNDQEPYRSYLAAQAAGNTPEPFLIGLKIEGGIYHGRQLVLPWPGTYKLPPHLPEVGGNGGNEGNAGSDNKDDGTEEGQRPNLPQNPQEEPETNVTPTPAEEQDTQTGSPQTQQEPQKLPLPDSSQPPTDRQKQSSDLSRTNRKQNGFPGRTTGSGDDSNDRNTGGTPAGIDTETASLAIAPANSSPSASQEENLVDFAKTGRQGHLRPVMTVAAAGICIAAVTARLYAKRRHVRKC